MELTDIQKSQRDLLALFRPSQGGASPSHSAPEVAQALGLNGAAARLRCLRAERTGWLSRTKAGEVWAYQIAPKGLERLAWLEQQKAPDYSKWVKAGVLTAALGVFLGIYLRRKRMDDQLRAQQEPGDAQA